MTVVCTEQSIYTRSSEARSNHAKNGSNYYEREAEETKRTAVSAVSVVNACMITDPEPDSLQFQQDCKVRVGRNIYSGKVAAIGKCYAIILCPLAYYVYFYVRRHKLWSFNVAIVLAGSEEEMKRLVHSNFASIDTGAS